MAAVVETAGTRRDMVAGGMRGVKADVTSVDDSDTWSPGLRIIEYWDFAPALAGAATQVGGAASSTTGVAVLTLKVESGTLTGTLTAWGF